MPAQYFQLTSETIGFDTQPVTIDVEAARVFEPLSAAQAPGTPVAILEQSKLAELEMQLMRLQGQHRQREEELVAQLNASNRKVMQLEAKVGPERIAERKLQQKDRASSNDGPEVQPLLDAIAALQRQVQGQAGELTVASQQVETLEAKLQALDSGKDMDRLQGELASEQALCADAVTGMAGAVKQAAESERMISQLEIEMASLRQDMVQQEVGSKEKIETLEKLIAGHNERCNELASEVRYLRQQQCGRSSSTGRTNFAEPEQELQGKVDVLRCRNMEYQMRSARLREYANDLHGPPLAVNSTSTGTTQSLDFPVVAYHPLQPTPSSSSQDWPCEHFQDARSGETGRRTGFTPRKSCANKTTPTPGFGQGGHSPVTADTSATATVKNWPEVDRKEQRPSRENTLSNLGLSNGSDPSGSTIATIATGVSRNATTGALTQEVVGSRMGAQPAAIAVSTADVSTMVVPTLSDPSKASLVGTSLDFEASGVVASSASLQAASGAPAVLVAANPPAVAVSLQQTPHHQQVQWGATSTPAVLGRVVSAPRCGHGLLHLSPAETASTCCLHAVEGAQRSPNPVAQKPSVTRLPSAPIFAYRATSASPERSANLQPSAGVRPTRVLCTSPSRQAGVAAGAAPLSARATRPSVAVMKMTSSGPAMARHGVYCQHSGIQRVPSLVICQADLPPAMQPPVTPRQAWRDMSARMEQVGQ